MFLNLPLTAGAVAGGILTLGAPWLAILAALAGLVAKIRIEITRDEPEGGAEAKSDAPPPPPADPQA